MKHTLGVTAFLLVLLSSCVGDDFVDDEVGPVISITNPIDSMALDSMYAFQMAYLNNIGSPEDVQASWSSTDEEIIVISNAGVVSALSPGSAEIQVEYSNGKVTVSDSKVIGVA